MLRFLVMFVAGLTAFSSVAAAQAVKRLRGTIESVQGDTLTLKSADGTTSEIAIGADSKFASVVPSDLSAVKPGVFIGTATKGSDQDPVSLEVVVFPDSMRGTAEGHYPWDELPDRKGGGAMKSSMTNGTVAAATKPHMVKSAMTNGTVATDAAKGGGKELSVTFSGGKKLDIHVPANVPVVALEPSDRSIATVGAKAFIVAADTGGKLAAKLLLVGKNGLTPPM